MLSKRPLLTLVEYSKVREILKAPHSITQVQAIGMYGAAQPDFFKSETT